MEKLKELGLLFINGKLLTALLSLIWLYCLYRLLSSTLIIDIIKYTIGMMLIMIELNIPFNKGVVK